MLLVFLNLAVKRLLPFGALSQKEFVVVFVILTLERLTKPLIGAPKVHTQNGSINIKG